MYQRQLKIIMQLPLDTGLSISLDYKIPGSNIMHIMSWGKNNRCILIWDNYIVFKRYLKIPYYSGLSVYEKANQHYTIFYLFLLNHTIRRKWWYVLLSIEVWFINVEYRLVWLIISPTLVCDILINFMTFWIIP